MSLDRNQWVGIGLLSGFALLSKKYIDSKENSSTSALEPFYNCCWRCIEYGDMKVAVCECGVCEDCEHGRDCDVNNAESFDAEDNYKLGNYADYEILELDTHSYLMSVGHSESEAEDLIERYGAFIEVGFENGDSPYEIGISITENERLDNEVEKAPINAFKLHSFAKPELTYEEGSPPQRIIDEGWWMYDAPAPNGWFNIHLVYDPVGEYNVGQFCSNIDPAWIESEADEIKLYNPKFKGQDICVECGSSEIPLSEMDGGEIGLSDYYFSCAECDFSWYVAVRTDEHEDGSSAGIEFVGFMDEDGNVSWEPQEFNIKGEPNPAYKKLKAESFETEDSRRQLKKLIKGRSKAEKKRISKMVQLRGIENTLSEILANSEVLAAPPSFETPEDKDNDDNLDETEWRSRDSCEICARPFRINKFGRNLIQHYLRESDNGVKTWKTKENPEGTRRTARNITGFFLYENGLDALNQYVLFQEKTKISDKVIELLRLSIVERIIAGDMVNLMQLMDMQDEIDDTPIFGDSFEKEFGAEQME
tara:strand:+ start:19 stop:1623 length:1605 start_codon:yes stop_codon:yes gene_type:complete